MRSATQTTKKFARGWAPPFRPGPGDAACAFGCVALLLALVPAAAQQTDVVVPGVSDAADSVTVVAGPEYEAEGWRARFFGEEHRALWTAPVRVPVLDLDRFAGGLTPLRRGGGRQTKVLHLTGADGRRYVFRSVNKDPALAEERDLHDTWIADVIHDQTSSLLPAGAAVADALLDAAGVLHAVPHLVVLPDSPELGEYRDEFGGLLGMIEVRPNEGENDTPGFAGSTRVSGTAAFLEDLEDSPNNRVDARAFLTARLMDIFLGDWDRHADNWRWARFDRGDELDVWVPIPRDRDYVFVNYDGLFMKVGRSFYPKGVQFEEEYDHLPGLLIAGQALDRRLLAELPRSVWDSVTTTLQARLTDARIDQAVRRLPPEYYAVQGPELARILKARRAGLSEAADYYYNLLAGRVDVHASDKRDYALVERQPSGLVDVRLYRIDKDTDAPRPTPYFQRTLRPSETDEVRVYLHGDDDVALVRGPARGKITVRVIGGGGDDVLVDSSTATGSGRRTAFYDDRGHNRFVRARGTVVDTRDYEAPADTFGVSDTGFRDWGSSASWAPWLWYTGEAGLIAGARRVYTRYGFRQEPYSRRQSIGAAYGFGAQGFAVEYLGDFRYVNSPLGLWLHARASQFESQRFFGFGNSSTLDQGESFYVVPSDQVLVESLLNWRPTEQLRVGGGPLAKYTGREVRPGTPLAELDAYGRDRFGQVGAQADVEYDTRDDEGLPTRGFRIRAHGAAYPPAWDVEETFGTANAEASTYLTLPARWAPTLALRVGGQRVWGRFPVHEAAFLGGSRTLRGYSSFRFAGDAALYGTAELRSAPVRANLHVIRGDLGAFLLTDAGRVYRDGLSDGAWHAAAGAGAYFSFQINGARSTFSAYYAYGDRGRLYARLGLPF